MPSPLSRARRLAACAVGCALAAGPGLSAADASDTAPRAGSDGRSGAAAAALSESTSARWRGELPKASRRPVVARVTGRSGPASGGVAVTIAGKRLGGVTKVRFGGTPASRVSVVSAGKLRVVTPAHRVGRVKVTVVAGGRQSPARPGARYRYVHVQPALAGAFHTVALRRDGTVFTWGSDLFGEQPDPNSADGQADRPQRRPLLRGARAVAAGFGRTIAVMWDGTVRNLGWSASGALGNDDYHAAGVPRTVKGLTGAVAAAGGYSHSVALRRDGTVRAWGDNTYGQLGDGSFTDRHRAVAVRRLTGVTAVATGNCSSYALRDDGTVWTWGCGWQGSLGDGQAAIGHVRARPGKVAGLTDVVAIAGGQYQVLALRADGTVWTWGGGWGLAGSGSTVPADTPAQVPGLTDVVAVTGGETFSSVVREDGSVWSWGASAASGQMGTGGGGSATPVRATGINAASAVMLQGPHRSHNIVMRRDGTLLAWGWNLYGQLGVGPDHTNRSEPVRIRGLDLR